MRHILFLRNTAVLSSIGIFFLFCFPSFALSQTPAINPKLLTQCLREKSFTMYGEKKCSACAIQKDYFGVWFSRVPYIDCDDQRALCDQKNIHAYPTWENTLGKQYKGAIPLTKLSELAGCTMSSATIREVQPTTHDPAQPEITPVDTSPSPPGILTQTAIFSALIAGFLSFFAPCLLPLYPTYFSVITGFTFLELYGLTHEHIRRRIFLSSVVFSFGFSLIFILLGATGSLVGKYIYEYLNIFIRVSGGILIFLGLMQIGIITPSSQAFDYAWNIQRRFARMGYITAWVTGITAALSWIPCIGPLLSSILLIAGQSTTFGEGMILLGIYSLGLTLPFVLSGLWFPSMLSAYQEHKHILHRISQVAGIFLIAYGILLVTNQYQSSLQYLKETWSFVSSTITTRIMVE